MIRTLTRAVAFMLAAVATAPAANADPMSDLVGLMPRGYAPDACQPGDVMGEEIVVLNCDGGNSIPGAPDGAVYALLPSPDRANYHFEKMYGGHSTPTFVPGPCPGNPDAGISRWAGGRLACGAVDGAPFIIYFNGPVLGALRGHDLPSMYAWWMAADL